jgi:hypothetical protein
LNEVSVMAKRTPEEEINAFLEIWGTDDLLNLLEEISLVFETFYMENTDSPILEGKTDEEIANIRIVRSVYLISKIAELYGGKFCMTKMKVPRLYEKLENVK